MYSTMMLTTALRSITHDLTDDELSELMVYAKPDEGSSVEKSTPEGTTAESTTPESGAYANQSPAPLFALVAGLGVAFLIKRRSH